MGSVEEGEILHTSRSAEPTQGYETYLPSFLQSPLKDRCVRSLPRDRENESPRLHCALKYTALPNELMQFLGGRPPRESAGWRRAEGRNGEENG